ncbi:hypothetical protein RHMOL_Rhmol05G0226400 [Rhododendron molle]|uniref:Uncharacterized protein n=1 Tax=Rhododendron molle TaxID=49168 RepID=A0ACC0NU48_RHOML|nr:hypothetical protein RHMOL_Rhmol05G0226400 [Rhododendron molle]
MECSLRAIATVREDGLSPWHHFSAQLVKSPPLWAANGFRAPVGTRTSVCVKGSGGPHQLGYQLGGVPTLQ